MNITTTIKQINRWDYRGFGWQEIFTIGFGLFLPMGIGIGLILGAIL